MENIFCVQNIAESSFWK